MSTLRNRLESLFELVGEPTTPELIEQVKEAADIMEFYEGVIKSLFELADDAIELIDDPAQRARAARSLKSDQLAIRAQRLRLSKMSASAIGRRMARDDGREEPYDARQVRRWLARQVGKAD